MSKTVLCIDDASSMRVLVKNTLADAGFTILEAENGKVGLDTAAANKVDMFLVDVNMPVMNGFEFVENIKKQSGYKTTPIVMLTTESSDQNKLKGKELGISGWVVKPFDPQSLQKIVSALLGL